MTASNWGMHRMDKSTWVNSPWTIWKRFLYISVYNGQKSDIFQPAKDFGSSGSVYLRSRTPAFNDGKDFNLKTTIKTDSFDLINPSLLYEHKLNDKISTSFNVELINSSGKYKYRYKRVYPNSDQVMYDTTAVRQNGDVYSSRLEGGLYGITSDGYWRFKTYFYDSNKGIPGAIVNNVWKNSQRQRDKNFFAQGSFQQSISPKYEVRGNVKYAYDYMNYVNPDTTLMLIDNTFKQQELYISIANKYAITNNWDIALSADMQYNTLRSDLDGFVFPKRLTTLIALASALEIGKIKMQGSLLPTFALTDSPQLHYLSVSKMVESGHIERLFNSSSVGFDAHNCSVKMTEK